MAIHDVEAMHAEEAAAERRAYDIATTSIAEMLDAIGEWAWLYSGGYADFVHRQLDHQVRERGWARDRPPPKPTERPRFSKAHRLLHELGERDGWTCRYCAIGIGCPCDPDLAPAVADHVHPRARGGSDDPENRVLACVPCNTAKADRTPSEWGGPWVKRDDRYLARPDGWGVLD